ncbi:DUF1127 domain-containing protein [Paracoccus caeni]|uniref:DUF1127 domain-containing protein n=1 Tax=Paracoccus caeni TaxID=657651 RepID=A0A934SGP3_9RHOB|nr:DUF1127 domain-containing protein [Paracoccus caeni]MBK4217104.1 DUF1127 domain-containing protein [Paracoccus caeni]
MAYKSTAALSTATHVGILPRQSWLKRIITMFDVRKTRLDLAHLSDEQLRDIGVTREQVETELQRPVWDVPNNWRRH